jgi:hypothetical protein
MALVLSGCSEKSWPEDDDVYHTQIRMPPKEMPRAGAYYIDKKTGKIAPEVCDTYGSGLTVCRQASFDEAPPVKQFRAELAKRTRSST